MPLINTSRFGRLLGSVKKQFKRLASKWTYDFWESMQNNEVAKAANSDKAAVQWYEKNYKNNPDKYVKRKIMLPGTLCMFDYDTPKYADVLDFWDRNPLVLVLTPFYTKEEKIRILGINLHLLPPKIRQLVLYQAFLMYKSEYTAQLFSDKKALQVNVSWQTIKSQLERYGAGFAVRMYIPSLQKNIIEFNQDDWDKAIWIPSRAYAKTNINDLEMRWKDYVKNQGRKVATAGESHKNR
jgi:hypothetical protein